MNHTKFAIRRFDNRNGVTSWRVEGYLHGVRFRKNFKTREEAAAEQAALEIRAINEANGLHTIATPLTPERVREAEAMFHRLADRGRPLSFYVDFALANYREPEQQKPLSDAVAEYVAAKEHEFEQDHIPRPQLARIRWDLRKLQGHFLGRVVAELTVPGLVAFLEIGRPSMKTYNNRRGILSTFFKFALHRSWIVENPILRVPHYQIRRRRGLATTFTAAPARDLMDHFEGFEGGRWVPHFALCLFAGIRPGVPDGEITKLRPEAVCLTGLAIGIAGSYAAARVIAGMLYGLSPMDPPTFAGGVVLLFTISLLAGAIPSMGASRLDPLTALRRDWGLVALMSTTAVTSFARRSIQRAGFGAGTSEKTRGAWRLQTLGRML